MWPANCCLFLISEGVPRLIFILNLFQQTNFKEPIGVFKEEELSSMKMKYYNEDVHQAAFSLPNFIRQALKES